MGSRSPIVEKLVSIPPFWRLVLSLIVAGTLLGIWLFAFVHNMLVSGKDLPVALHSPLEADYGADAVAFIPAARMNLLSEAIADEANAGNNAPDEQIATLVDQMRTPVFTVTPYPGMTSQPGAQPTQARMTNTPADPDQTPVAPSQTVAAPTITVSATVQTPSATVTATRGFAVTVTPGFYFPTRTSTATAASTKTPNPTYPPMFASPTHTTAPTRVPATQTPVPQQPTNTSVPPTHTLAPPTSTPQPPTPSNTPVPPTDTPVPYPPPGTSYP